MQTVKGKTVKILHDSHPDNLSQLLLSLRGVEEDFFSRQIVHDPFLLPDIHEAVERIDRAKKNGEKVMIFGDYDVDGISATAALFLFLQQEAHMAVSYRLPHRVKDGYGMKFYHIDEIAETGTKLIITVDCGTKDKDIIAYARAKGIDVIVTDHHSCPDTLPDCIAVVNPQRRDSLYPFSRLSGSGVVWKFIHALALHWFPGRVECILQKYVDIISLGTVADCMPMVDENRTIVQRGIQQSRDSHHPFFQIFSQDIGRPIRTEDDIGFFIGPLLNAGGRLTTPYQSLSALLSSHESAFEKVQELMKINDIRKQKTLQACEKACQNINSSDAFLTYIDPDLEHGILGLVAARLTEIYQKPSAVFTFHEGHYTGSLRAPLGIDLVSILDENREFLTRYGGHAGAAGCTIREDMLHAACAGFDATAQRFYPEKIEQILTIDSILRAENIDLSLISSIQSLRPFGEGFSSPLFMLENISSEPVSLGKTGEHIRWNTNNDLEILGFHMAQHIQPSQFVHLIGTLNIHTWRDIQTPQFHVTDMIIG